MHCTEGPESLRPLPPLPGCEICLGGHTRGALALQTSTTSSVKWADWIRSLVLGSILRRCCGVHLSAGPRAALGEGPSHLSLSESGGWSSGLAGRGVIERMGLDSLVSGFSHRDKLTFAGIGARKKAFKEM